MFYYYIADLQNHTLSSFLKPSTVAKTKQLVSWSLSLLQSEELQLTNKGVPKRIAKTRESWKNFCEHLACSGHGFLLEDHLGPADVVVAFVAHRLGLNFTSSPTLHRWNQAVYQHDLVATNQKVRSGGYIMIHIFASVLLRLIQ